MWNKGDILQDGQYLIQEKLGEGGFGVTYKAWHNHLKKSVVIKTPNNLCQNDPDYARYVRLFKEEAQRLDSLLQDESHPHIVKIRDLFQESQSGNFCIVMDFIDGKSLFTIIEEEGKLSEKQALKYINEIASALIFVHDRGIIHRDAHPGNIMIDEKDRAILIDFGIAIGISYNVNTYRRCGSEFAPPDQLWGNSQPNVDIYTLAASLYYAVTSNLPKRNDNHELIAPIQYIKTLNPKINRAILRGMSALPKDRPQSMDKWIEMLALDRESLSSKINKLTLLFLKLPYKSLSCAFFLDYGISILFFVAIPTLLNIEPGFDSIIYLPIHFFMWLPLIKIIALFPVFLLITVRVINEFASSKPFLFLGAAVALPITAISLMLFYTSPENLFLVVLAVILVYVITFITCFSFIFLYDKERKSNNVVKINKRQQMIVVATYTIFSSLLIMSLGLYSGELLQRNITKIIQQRLTEP
jgi:serine/threonine protein kinase